MTPKVGTGTTVSQGVASPVAVPPRTRSADPFSVGGAIQVTFDKATEWLAKIGGTWTEEHRGPDSFVVVTVKSAKGAMVSARAPFDDASEARHRELEFQRAFVWACLELKGALG